MTAPVVPATQELAPVVKPQNVLAAEATYAEKLARLRTMLPDIAAHLAELKDLERTAYAESLAKEYLAEALVADDLAREILDDVEDPEIAGSAAEQRKAADKLHKWICAGINRIKALPLAIRAAVGNLNTFQRTLSDEIAERHRREDEAAQLAAQKAQQEADAQHAREQGQPAEVVQAIRSQTPVPTFSPKANTAAEGTANTKEVYKVNPDQPFQTNPANPNAGKDAWLLWIVANLDARRHLADMNEGNQNKYISAMSLKTVEGLNVVKQVPFRRKGR